MPTLLCGAGDGGQNRSELLSDTARDQPFPGRDKTMYMGVLGPSDCGTKGPRICRDTSLSLTTHDIEGAQPVYRQSLLYKNGPVEKERVPGDAPKEAYPPRRQIVEQPRPTSDIERAEPNVVRLKSKRSVNPLWPHYDLPSVALRPPTPPRQAMHEGRPWDMLDYKGEWRPAFPQRSQARDPNDNSDIVGARARPRSTGGLTPRDPLKTVERAGERILCSKHCSERLPQRIAGEAAGLSTRAMHPPKGAENETPRPPKEVAPVTPRWLSDPEAGPMTRSEPYCGSSQRFKGSVAYNIYDASEKKPEACFNGLYCADIPGAVPKFKLARTPL